MAAKRYAYRLGWRSLRRVIGKDPSGQWILAVTEAKQLARDLAQAMVDFDITTRQRASMWIAQIAHESGGFRYREEIASGFAYEGRRDLGNTHPGDGPRYKGRTYIQITGRTNYQAVAAALKVDFIAHPERLAAPAYAAKGAAWWWKRHGCNQLADTGDFIAVTRRINGGTNGLAERQKYYGRARLVSPFLVPKRRKP